MSPGLAVFNWPHYVINLANVAPYPEAGVWSGQAVYLHHVEPPYQQKHQQPSGGQLVLIEPADL